MGKVRTLGVRLLPGGRDAAHRSQAIAAPPTHRQNQPPKHPTIPTAKQTNRKKKPAAGKTIAMSPQRTEYKIPETNERERTLL